MLKNYFPILCLKLLLLSTIAFSKKPLAPALYCFGDSLFDSGNNNYLQTFSKANFTLYGVDFFEVPTGRFNNGRNFVDFLAEKLGLPYAPPYLSLVGKKKPVTGVNYASASCGILDETGKRLGECLPLTKQIDYFEATMQQLKMHFPARRSAKKYLANSILAITIGSNDYFNNYLQTHLYNTSSKYTPQKFAQLLIDRYSQLLKRLYKLGARKFVVFDIGPLGCIPVVLRATNSTGPCADNVNEVLVMYNQKLEKMLLQLRSELYGSKLVHATTYSTSLDMYFNPTKYGFEVEKVPCCSPDDQLGTCIPGGAICQDRNKRLNYDAIHPSERVNSIFADNCFDQSPSVCSPLTVKQLAQA